MPTIADDTLTAPQGAFAPGRWFVITLSALLAAVVACFWFPTYLPLVDHPAHLGLNAALINYSDTTAQFSTYYEVEWTALPYAVFRLFNVAVGWLVGASAAARLFLSLYAILIPLATLFLLRTLRRNHWFSLFSIPFIFNANLQWGFVPFCMASALFLVGIALLERLAQAPSTRRYAVLSLFSALLFLTHAQIFLLWGLAVGLLVLVDERLRWRALFLILGPAVLLLMAPWAWFYFIKPRQTATSSIRLTGDNTVWLGVWPSIRNIETALFSSSTTAGAISDAVVALATLVLLGLSLRYRWRDPNWRTGLRHEWLILLLVGLYFALPYKSGGQFYISPRVLLLPALLLPATLRQPLQQRWERALCIALLLAMALTSTVVTALHWHWFQAEVGHLDRALAKIPKGKRLLAMTHGKSALFDVPVYDHMGAYYMVRRGGFYANNFNTIGVKPRKRWWVFMKRGRISPRFVRYAHYVLLREPGRLSPHLIHTLPEDWFEPVYRDRHWELYRTRQVLSPPQAPATR